MIRIRLLLPAALGMIMLAAACQPVASSTPTPFSTSTPLTGTEWLLNEMHGEQLIHAATVTALFGDDEALRGRAGCNDYATRYQTDGSKITIDPNFEACENVCGEAIMAEESEYLASLEEVASYELAEEVLFMRDSSGEVLLVYDAQNE